MSGQTVCLNAYENVFAVFNIAANERDMAHLVKDAFEDHHAEVSVGRR